MKAEIVKKEVEFDCTLSEKEVQCISEAFKFYLKHNGSPVAGIAYELEKNFAAMLQSCNLEQRENVPVPTYYVNAHLLTEKNVIYLSDHGIIDYNKDSAPVDKLKLFRGNNNQLGIGIKQPDTVTYSKMIYFNHYCAELIRDFIENKGSGTYRGNAAYKFSGYTELNLYIDNQNNTWVIGNDSDLIGSKSLKLRYYSKDNSFGIIKNDEQEIRLNYIQALILKDFIIHQF